MSDMFPKSALLRPGYRPEQVDRYFETAHEIYDAGELDEMDSEGVRTVAFDVVLRGYQPQAVDAALDRLEAAFLQRRRALYPRLLRPAGERFAPASGQGYDKTDVDALMDRIAGYFDSDTTLTSSEVRGAVFRRARGNKAYGEPSVDRYLARVVEVLLSVE